MAKSETKTPETFGNLIELSRHFEDEQVCRKYLEKLLWEDGKPVCPKCKGTKIYSFPDGKRYKCANNTCYKIFTVTVGTYFQSTKIPLSKWLHSLLVFTSHKKGISSHQLAKDISVTQRTAWFILCRLREILKDKAPHMLEGMVQVDCTFVGGKLHYKSNKKRKEVRAKYPGKVHNDDSKVTVLGITDGNTVRHQIVQGEKAEHVLPIMHASVKEGSTIVSDQQNFYKNLQGAYTHESVNHGVSEYVNERGFSTNVIEGAFSHLKRGLIGVYHHASPKHLQKYCNEFSFRYNTRKQTEIERFNNAIKQAKGRLTYDELVREVAVKKSEDNNKGLNRWE